MVRIENEPLSKATLDALARYQQEVSDKPDYAERIKEAKRIWPSRRRNDPFKEVKAKLDAMCSGARRCMYCEDSLADEVEHILPKDVYPSQTFVWDNYLYACGPCNGPKSNRTAYFTPSMDLLKVSAPTEEPDLSALQGLINPRAEDPSEHLSLLLKVGQASPDFCFVQPRFTEEQDPVSYQRADYTIDILGLNRPTMIKSRQRAYEDYQSRLYKYADLKRKGKPAKTLDKLRNRLLDKDHPFVWRQMQRQAELPELKALFDGAPEALSW